MIKVSQVALSLEGARLNVHLGCSAEERATPQEVRLAAKVYFPELPPGCSSDRLDETICYAEMVQWARDYVTGKEFALVESLGFELATLFSKNFSDKTPQKIKFDLKVHKVNPPVPDLSGGVVFELRDIEVRP